MSAESNGIVIEEVTDAVELEHTRRQRQRFDRNAEWLQEHPEVLSQHRGKFICIAGQEVFAADTVADAIALATAAHPDDDGWFTRYVPKERVPRVYAL